MEILTEIILRNIERNRPNSVVKVTIEDVFKRMAMLNTFTFEVTESCNLNCYYCIYNDLYTVNKRHKRGNAKMPIDMMKKTFLYFSEFWERNQPYGNHLNIGFYGGEPFLNMDLIKETVLYVKKIFPNSSYRFTLTTNGLLINKYVDFLVENDFKIMISLDGDKIHNSYRVTHNGENSFNKIAKNLDFLISNYNDYFLNNVTFNSILHDKNDSESVIDFFRKKYNKTPRLSSLALREINEQERGAFNKIYKPKYGVIEKQDINKEFINSQWGRTILEFMGKLGLRYHSFNELLYPQLSNLFRTGSCVPFENVFVLADGTLLPCEKADFDNEFGNINDIESIDFVGIVDKYNSFIRALKDSYCNHCFNQCSCQTCIFQIGNINSKEPVNCYKSITRSKLALSLDHLCEFIKVNPTVINKVSEILMNEKYE